MKQYLNKNGSFEGYAPRRRYCSGPTMDKEEPEVEYFTVVQETGEQSIIINPRHSDQPRCNVAHGRDRCEKSKLRPRASLKNMWCVALERLVSLNKYLMSRMGHHRLVAILDYQADDLSSKFSTEYQVTLKFSTLRRKHSHTQNS